MLSSRHSGSVLFSGEAKSIYEILKNSRRKCVVAIRQTRHATKWRFLLNAIFYFIEVIHHYSDALHPFNPSYYPQVNKKDHPFS